MSNATSGQRADKENGDVPAADSLLVFSYLLELLEMLFQDLKVSWYKPQEFSKGVSLD